jgi:hypothetical protein
MDYDDCEPAEFYSESYHVARKPHCCAECGTAIMPGERYIACRGKWDGDFDVFKQHLECLHACVAVRKYQDNQCIPFGGLLEWYETCYHAKRKWPRDLRSAMAAVLRRRRASIICSGRRKSI